ncbi:MAG TPA: clostripain-related cysteine peptidase [Pyrinomonadaceae bacterium]|nr:clostripain-related cysteine peptidase [Pyrinomonadaceae bacterium]
MSSKNSSPSRPPAKKSRPVRPVPEPKSEWSILCYFVGDGLISSSMISQLKGITDAGFQEHTNVLVYFDPNCNGRRARIFNVNARRKKEYSHPKTHKKTIIGDGVDPYVRDIADDSHLPGLPQIPAAITLRYFLEYARTYYPAKNYMLFLVGHGVIVGNDAFLPDPDDQSAITLTDLGWILTNFGKKVRAENDEFHLVGFHSCSMSSVELLYELEGSARYMIGTQGPAFPGSWPYRQLLKKILLAIDQSVDARNGNGARRRVQGRNGGPTQQPDELLKSILRGMQDLSYYNTEDFGLAGFSSDIALCSLESEKIANLRNAITNLSRALKAGINEPATKNCIQLAHLESQSYFGENYTDLIDFCECLARNCNGRTKIQTEINQACTDVIKALRNEEERNADFVKTDFKRLVISSDYHGPAYQYSNGLSIYFPWKSPSQTVTDSYDSYKFTQDHGPDSWLSFLRQYFINTQRPVRDVRYPRNTAPEVVNFIRWEGSDNLLRTISDKQLLSLGPPPEKAGGDLSKAGGDLSKVGGELSKVGGELSKVGGELSGKVGGELTKVGGELSKVGGEMSKVAELSDQVGGELSKVGGELSKLLGQLSKVGGELSDNGNSPMASKVGGELSKLVGYLSKVGGELSKVGGELSGKVGGELSKVGGELSKVSGELSSKVGGELSSKVGGELSKVGGEMSKVGGEFGGLFGQTVIKNFSEPEGKFVTSRDTTYLPESAQAQPGKQGGGGRYNTDPKGSR